MGLTASLLSACSNLQQAKVTDTSKNLPAQTATPVEKIIPERPFPAETLYSLLVAELAGSRSRFDIALGNYMQQAHMTRDPGVAARATRIARFLNAHREALESAQLWTQIEPDNTEAHFIAASELARIGRLLEALDEATQLIDDTANSAIFQNIAARAATATDTQREQLLFRYQQLLGQHLDHDGLILGIALIQQQNNQLDKALALTEQLLSKDPDHVTGIILQSRLLEQLEKPEQALDLLSRKLSTHPEEVRLRLQYARLLASYDLDKAYDQFEILHAQSPHDPDILFSLALISHEQGNLSGAKDFFEQLIVEDARTSSAHYYLARIAEAENDLNGALEHYLQVKPGPDFLPATSQLIDILIRAGELEAANNHLDAIRQRFPKESARLHLLESEKLGKYQYLEEAEQALTKGLTFDPDNNQLLYARAMINERRNFIDLLELDLRSILRYDPNHVDALNALGYTLADRTTRYSEALELITQALRIKPNDPAIMDSMGWVQYHLGNYEEAILRLREALKQLADPVIASHLAEVLWVSGKQDEAKSIWQNAINQSPTNPIIQEAIKRLGVQLDSAPKAAP